MPLPISRIEKLLWWLDRWFWWTVNGSFRQRATRMMLARSTPRPANGFVKSVEVE